MFLSELKIWNFRKYGSGNGGAPGLHPKLNKRWVDEARYQGIIMMKLREKGTGALPKKRVRANSINNFDPYFPYWLS